MRKAQRGFTLTELAVVIAIVGVLSTLAIVYMRPQTKAIDVATRFGDMVSEASRLAAMYGPVRADVAAAHGKARTAIEIDPLTAGAHPTFVLKLILEQPEPSNAITEQEIQRYDVDKLVTAESYANTAGTYATVTPISNWATFRLECYSNGTCQPRTLFFSQANGPTSERNARVEIMPLGAAAYVQPAWN